MPSTPLNPRIVAGDISEELLQRAIDNLEHEFCFVGLTERFEESLFLMRHYLGVQSIEHRLGKVGTRPNVQNVDAATLQRIKEKNQLDIRLYDLARER